MKGKAKYIKTITIGFLNLIAIYSMAQNPLPSFNTDQTSGCSPLTIQFTNTSLNASTYYWDFGNGNTSVFANPSNVYANAGTYSVKLVAIASNGQKDSVISNNLITVSSNSISNFHALNTISCLDGNVFSFVNTSVNSVSCLWDFGDGYTSALTSPVHTYASHGNYAVKLITYDSYGCSNIKISGNYIHVNANPVTTFDVNTTIGCNLSQIFNFTCTTPAVNAWFWNFGDGTTSTLQNPTHLYSAAGNYTVSLKTTNAAGCTNTMVVDDYIAVFLPQIPAFTSNTTTGCLPVEVAFTNLSSNSVEWLWDFGDGTTSIDETPSHTYQNSGNYNVSLKITADYGCTYTKTVNNYIHIANTAFSNFSISNTSSCAPINIQFINQSSNAVSCLWEFGDGATSSLLNPSHTYTANGSYTVTLHSYSASGCDAISQQLNAVVLNLPVADYSATFSPGCAPLPANFINSSSNSIQWLWRFGDGTTSTLQNPSHTYNSPGDYDVSLVAWNSLGCSDTLTHGTFIHVINMAGSFIPPATITGCIPFNTTFSNTTTGAVSWVWDFGDGNTSTQQNPSHTYISSGFYTVSLTVQLTGGCTQFYPNFRTFDIKGGQTGFTFLTQTQCSPYIVNFSGTYSESLSTCLWDFGDGATSTLQNPLHTYFNPGDYTVKYISTTSEGCTSTSIAPNGLHFTPCISSGTDSVDQHGGSASTGGSSVTYHLPPLDVCIPFIAHFNNILSQSIAWFWSFGDGTTSMVQNPFHTYTTIGNYNVTLIGQRSSGQSDTIIYSDYIHASGINTDFSFTETSDCINTSLSFTGLSTNASAWNWNFGDGNTSILQNPVETVSNTVNNHTITLTTSNALGCSGSMHKNILITANSAAIWANSYTACANQSLNFNCASSNFIAYLWDFGDGTTSTLQNPVHSYLAGGSFQVTVKLTENNGCSHTSTMQNLVTIDNPIANFTSTLANGCGSKAVVFANSSAGISLPFSNHCKWNFGDGSAEQWAENPTHVYATFGTYLVTLTVNHDNACYNSITKIIKVQPIAANFGFTQNTNCFPITASFVDSSNSSAVSWLWDFGDGTTSTLQTPVHIFTTTPVSDVSLSIKDAYGCQATITKTNITIFNTDFWISVTDGCSPMAVDFSDASLNANQWLWTFGDGTTSTVQNPNHVYLNNGSYDVTLISKSGGGCLDTLVFSSINVNKPVADFSSATPANCSPALVSFTDLSTDAVSWLWDFGDGSSSMNQHPGHIYNVSGLYTIKLIVTNTFGCSDTLIRVNYIEVLGPTANFSASANQSCIQSILQFTDASHNAISWNWNFGDGTTSTLQNPSNSYQNSGLYTVSLIVNDSHGCTSNFTFPNPVVINPLPTADFTVSDTVSCTPFPVAFQNNSLNAVSYVWNFGDGYTSALQAPSHIYSNSGIYSVSLTATNQFGCADVKVFNSIVANKTPDVNFVANNTGGCSPLSVSFTDSSATSQNTDYFWNFGNGLTSTQQNPVTTFINPGTYAVSLLITNNNGCSDTLIKTAYIEVDDLNPPSKSIIQFVTVVSNTSTQLKWNQSTANDFSHYEIYRKDNSTGNYSSIATINNSAIVTFLDFTNLNTLENSYCYKVQTIDNCGNTLPLDSLQEHCTINATAKGYNEDIQINWSSYIGASVNTYSIYRMETVSDIPVLVATVPSSILSIIDTTLACPFYYSYRIKANNLNGSSGCSYSDTSIAKPMYNLLTQQKVDVVRSTVINNQEVLTEWKAPAIAPEKVTGYKIFKSTDNINFSLLTTVLSSVHEYIDNDVDVNKHNYYYKITLENSCDIATLESNKSSSILLKAELVNGITRLVWTGYEGWENGVGYYIIEKMNEQGQWETIKTVEGNVLISDENN